MHAMRYMSWCCGFWKHFLTDIYVVHRKIRPTDLTHSFFDNYNILALLIAVPAVTALILYLVNKCKYNSSN